VRKEAPDERRAALDRGGSFRVEPLAVDAARAAARESGIDEAMAPLGVYRVLLRHPKLAVAVNGLLTTLLWTGHRLEPRLRELLILRIAWVTGSVYEWTQHWRLARRLGIPREDLLAVRDWRASARLGPAERAVLAATDDTLGAGVIAAETWRLCEKHVGGPEELVEMVVAIGNWRMFSQLLRSLEIPLEDGVEAWPPDGQAPPMVAAGP